MRFTATHGRMVLTMRVFRQGRDVQVLCGGGEAHIGAVALAAPAPDGTAPARLLALPGHREDALALRMASRMAAALARTVCVSAGIHYDHITKEEIARVEDMLHDLTGRCLAALTKDKTC